MNVTTFCLAALCLLAGSVHALSLPTKPISLADIAAQRLAQRRQTSDTNTRASPLQAKMLYDKPATRQSLGSPAAGAINGARGLVAQPAQLRRAPVARVTQDVQEEPQEEQEPVDGEQMIDTQADGEAQAEGEQEEQMPEMVEVEPTEVQQEEEAPPEEPAQPEPGLSPIDERDELKAAIALIEFKLTEVNALMQECIEQEFTADVTSDSQTLMLSCTGLTYQILFHNFREGMRRVKLIFLDLLKKKMKALDEEYDDEIDFFLDVLEDFVDRDYKLTESLDISKKNVKYYVSPRFYESLLEIADPEIRAINAIHNRLKVSRKEVQDLIVKKMIERENYLKALDGQINQSKPEEPEEEEEQPQQPSFAADADNDEGPDYGDEPLPEDAQMQQEFDAEEEAPAGKAPVNADEESYDAGAEGPAPAQPEDNAKREEKEPEVGDAEYDDKNTGEGS